MTKMREKGKVATTITMEQIVKRRAQMPGPSSQAMSKIYISLIIPGFIYLEV